MRLVGRPVGVEKQQKISGAKEGQKLDLSVGKRISASIVEVSGEKVLLNVGGRLISAKNASSEQLYSGMNAEFEVVKSESDLIEIRPSVLSNLSSSERDESFVKATLLKLGLPYSEDNQQILNSIMKMGSLISKSGFNEAKLIFAQSMRLADALNVPVSAESFQQAESSGKAALALSMSPAELLSDESALSALKDAILSSLKTEPPTLSQMSSKAETLAEEPQKAVATEGKVLIDAEVNAPKDNVQTKLGDNEKLAGDISKDLGDFKHSGEKLINADAKAEIISAKDQTPAPLAKIATQFFNISEDKGSLLNSLVFLSKMGIKPSVFNIALSSGMLSGKLGVAEALIQLGDDVSFKDDSSLKQALELFKSSALKMDKLEKLDSEDLKQAVKTFQLLEEKLLSSELSPKKDAQQNLLQQNASLNKDMAPSWQNVIVPFLGKAGIEDIEMYVKKDGSKGNTSKGSSSEDRLVYLSLKTDNIERIKVRIDYKAKAINLVFMSDNEDIETYIKSQLGKLRERLDSLSDKNISISVNTDKDKISLVDFEYIGSSPSISKIDFRI